MTGQVVSVNVGQPQDHDWHGRTFTTAIFKQPVSGAARVGTDGVAGDRQADTRNHGGRYQAVYAYAAEDAAWWADELERPVVVGMFGENLTVSGIEVTGAPIGQRWRVGGAELQVTAPRIPCSNLGLRFGDTGMPRAFQAAARPGAYLTVLAEGEVSAGDRLEVLETPDHDITVGAVFRAYYARDRDVAKRMFELDGLPPGWQRWAREGWND